MLYYTKWRYGLMIAHERDQLMQSEFFRDLSNEKPVKLKGNDIKFWSSFNSPLFDNNDSEYAEIRLHYYNNNITQGGAAPIEEVPMKECQIDGMDPQA
jgi:hypothetical protein